MKTSDVIFRRKPAELWARALFLFLSVIFHLFLAYFFYTAKFGIEEFKTEKKIVFIRPVSFPLVFPNLKEHPPETSPAGKLPLEESPADTMGPSTETRTEKTTETAPHIPVPAEKQPAAVKPDFLRDPGPTPGRERLKAPLNPSRYLKPETLDEILRRAEREQREKAGITGNDGETGPVETHPGVSPYDDDNIVVDGAARAYFNGRGIDITPWARKVVEKINGNWSILPGFGPANGSSKGAVGIAVVFDPEGRVVSADVTRSSSIQYMDRAALNAVQMSAPYPAPPGRFPGGQLKVFFLFNYENI